MAPVQQTFCVIPELPSAFVNGGNTTTTRQSKPPMTTKQAKKLYKAATKVPKLSKAEQRRQDLMEQDRIRREFEKERNQARAKTARDKKKEKEDREKAEKKRKGLPLKEVHPSQDTLARFMRPLKPPKKKVKEDPKPPPSPSPPQTGSGDESDDASPIDDDRRPMKRQKLEQPEEQTTDATTCDQSLSMTPEPKGQDDVATELPIVEAEKLSPVVVVPSSNIIGDLKTEDQINKRNTNEFFSVDDGLDDDDFTALFSDVTPDLGPCSAKVPELQRSQQLLDSTGSLGAPDPALRPEEHAHPPADASKTTVFRNNSCSGSRHHKDEPRIEAQETDGNTRNDQPTIDPAEPPKVSFDCGSIASTTQKDPKPQTPSCQPLNVDLKAACSNQITDIVSSLEKPLSAGTSSRQTPVTRREPPCLPQTVNQPMDTSSNAKPVNPTVTQKMAPPPIPSRLESLAFAENRSALRPKTTPTPPAVVPNNPVPIRDETIDRNMLPSSTQLFLLNNLDDLFPSPSQEVQEIFERPRERHKRTLARQQPLPPPHWKPSITAAKVWNSHLTPHSTTVRQPVRRPLPYTRMNSTISPPKPKQNDVKPHDECKMSDGDFPFLSTQDVFMSSQDIRELEDDKYSPIKPLKPLSPIARSQAPRETESSKLNGTRAVIYTSDGQIMESGVAKTPKPNTPIVAGAHGHPPLPTDDPGGFSSQCSSLPDTPSLPRRNTRAPQSRFIHPRGVPRSSAKGVTPDNQRSSSSNPFRFKTPNHVAPRPSPAFNPNPKQSREAPRPSPKQFFTSSGTRELTNLAVERSKRSEREDTHTRRKATGETVKHELTKRLRETPQDKPIFSAGEKRPPSNHDVDDNDYELDEILLASDLANGSPPSRTVGPQAINAANSGVTRTSFQCPKGLVGALPAQARPLSPDEKKPESVVQGKPKSSYEKMLELAAKQKECHDQGGKHAVSLFDESEKENQEQDIPIASQGTDYGEAGWDVNDLDLDLDSF